MEDRRRVRRRARRNVTSRRSQAWLVWSAAGTAIAIGIVVVLLAASGVFGGGRGAAGESAQVTGADLLRYGHVKGSTSAPVTLVEFADFQCPYCRLFREGPLRQLEAEFVHSNRVMIVYRNMAILGAESLLAAEAAECAGAGDRFFEYHDLLYANQAAENSGFLTATTLVSIASRIGLDAGQFRACLDSHKYRQAVIDSTDGGRRAGVKGTPTIFINGVQVANPFDVDALRVAIVAALAKG